MAVRAETIRQMRLVRCWRASSLVESNVPRSIDLFGLAVSGGRVSCPDCALEGSGVGWGGGCGGLCGAGRLASHPLPAAIFATDGQTDIAGLVKLVSLT